MVTNLYEKVMKIFVSCLLIYFFVGVVDCQNKLTVIQNPNRDWKGISLFETTRLEVEQILGKAISTGTKVPTYNLEDERITIWYTPAQSTLKSSTDKCKWNLPDNKVIDMLVVFKHPKPIDSYVTNFVDYDKSYDSTTYPKNVYTNKRKGIRIVAALIEGKELITDIRFFATQEEVEKQCN